MYSTPVAINANTTLTAIAYQSGLTDSPVTSGVYTILTPVAAPSFTPGAGSYTSAQSVTISTSTGGATIRYTTDGSTPSETHGTVYSAPVTISATTTLQAIAYESGWSDSPVASGTYLLTARTLTAVSFTTSPPSTQPSGTTITITASATGGTNVQYQFWLYNPLATPTWSELQAYSAAATCYWTPSIPGNYLISVSAKDGVTGAEVSMLSWYGITGPTLTAVSLNTSPASPQPIDTTITLTAAATGGAAVQYQFWLYNPAATPAWSELQAYSANATCPWTPTAPGNYLLSTSARDGVLGTEVSTMSWYAVVNSLLSAVSLNVSPVSPQPINTKMTLTATATGGTNVQYQFWLYNPAATPTWSELQAYSTAFDVFLDAGCAGQLSASPPPRATASPARKSAQLPGMPSSVPC